MKVKSYPNILADPYRCPIIIFIILVILGLVINLILIWSTTDINRLNQPISTETKWASVLVGIAFTLVISIIYIGILYYLCRRWGRMAKFGSFTPKFSWLLFFVTLLVAFLISYFTALIVGEYLKIGFLWSPDAPKITNTVNNETGKIIFQ